MSVESLVGRLAPSPTGAQHVGNARTYLLAWLSVRSRGGKLVMRIEDIDSPRVKTWAIDQAMEDLRWLGLDWDEGPDCHANAGRYLQTQRLEDYRTTFAQLKRANRVYPCTCSRSDVAAAASAPHAGQEGPIYPGTCAGRSAADAANLAGRTFSWRFRAPDTTFVLDDGFAGRQRCHVQSELGDFVVFKQDGTPAYQFAVVHDDHAMRVTEVLRGDDLIASAFRQLSIFDFFGWTPPRFVHVPLVVGPDGRRLAKRHGDTRLATLRAQGVQPETLIGLLAHSCGLTASTAPITARELVDRFDLDALPREQFVLTSHHVGDLIDAG